MQIFSHTKELVKKEQAYSARILQNLMLIEKDKLYVDLKYPSLFSYLVRELKYSSAQATVRVNAVRLMLKSKKAQLKIAAGEMSLSNAGDAGKLLRQEENLRLIDEVVERAASESNRKFGHYVDTTFKKRRQEILVLDERTLEKLDRVRKIYVDTDGASAQDLSSYELLQILLEEKLKNPRGQLTKSPITKTKEKSVKQKHKPG